MTYYIDFSTDNINWESYCHVEGDMTLDMALEMAQTLAEQGLWVNVWDCGDNLVWNQGRRYERPSSLMEQEWEAKGIPVMAWVKK